MKRVSRTFSGLLTSTGFLGLVLVCLVAVFIVALVIARVGFTKNIPGLFDFPIYLLIILPFLTAAYTLRRGGHICVDFLVSHLSERRRLGLEVGGYLASLIFVIILGWKTAQWTYKAFVLNQYTMAVFSIPQGILLSVIAFGCFLLFIELIKILNDKIRLMLGNQIAGTSSPQKLADNPLLYVAIFIAATAIGVLLFLQVNPVLGVVFVLMVLLLSGVPVFFGLGFTGVISLYLMGGMPALGQAPVTVFGALNKFTLTAIPLFVLGGIIMEEGKIMGAAFKFFELFTGRFAPSLLITTILTGALFCAITGSSVAATAVVTALAYPILLARGYRKSLISGILGGSTMGTLIPPSLAAILYGVVTEESIGRLFIALVIPAAIIYGFYILYVIALSILNKKWLFEGGQIPKPESTRKTSWKEKFAISRGASWALLTPVIVLGGIYTGIFTPTESAAILVVYAIIVCVLILRTVKWRDLFQSCARRSADFTSMVLLLIASGFILAVVGSQLRIAPALVAIAESAGLGPTGLIVLMFVIFNLLGMFLPASTIIVITAPIFHPLATALGIDGIWLGVFYIITGEMATLTPPVGLCMYTISGMSNMPMATVVKGLVPILLLVTLGVVILTIFPQLVLWLPNMMWGS